MSLPKDIAMKKFQVTEHDMLDRGGRNMSIAVSQIIPYTLYCTQDAQSMRHCCPLHMCQDQVHLQTHC